MTTEPQRHTRASKPIWRQVLDRHAPVFLPAAHDGLSARLIEQAGFVAFQVGGPGRMSSHRCQPRGRVTRADDGGMLCTGGWVAKAGPTHSGSPPTWKRTSPTAPAPIPASGVKSTRSRYRPGRLRSNQSLTSNRIASKASSGSSGRDP